MRLLVVNPNISQSVTDLIAAEARRAASPSTEIETATATLGVAYIETRAEAVVGAYATLLALAERDGKFDAAVVAAFGDPGLSAAKEMLSVPVVGLTEAALASAMLAGGRFSIIAISGRIAAWYRETVAFYGLESRMASLRSLDEPLSNIGRVQDEQGERLVKLCDTAATTDGADVIVLAGAPLAGLWRRVADRIEVPVVDGVASAVRHAESMSALALSGARSGSYAIPPKKDWQGLTPELSRLLGRA